jgi:hypothetical protein
MMDGMMVIAKTEETAMAALRRNLLPFIKHTITGWSKIAWDGKEPTHGNYVHGDRVFTLWWTKRPPKGSSSSEQIIGVQLKSGPPCYVQWSIDFMKSASSEGSDGVRHSDSYEPWSTPWLVGAGHGDILNLDQLTTKGVFSSIDDSITFVVRFQPLALLPSS